MGVNDHKSVEDVIDGATRNDDAVVVESLEDAGRLIMGLSIKRTTDDYDESKHSKATSSELPITFLVKSHDNMTIRMQTELQIHGLSKELTEARNASDLTKAASIEEEIKQKSDDLDAINTHMHTENDVKQILERNGADWSQRVKTSDNEVLYIQKPKFSLEVGDNIGISALTKFISSSSGNVPTVVIFLPASGFSLELDAVPEGDMIKWVESIYLEKEQIGRNSYGALLTTDTGHLQNDFFDLLWPCIKNTSLKNDVSVKKANLLKHIDSRDIYPILAGLGILLYPKGYPIYRECVTPDCSNNYSASPEKVEPDEIMHYSRSLLTDWGLFEEEDIKQLMAPMNSLSIKEVQAYQARLARRQLSEFTSIKVSEDENVAMYLKLSNCSFSKLKATTTDYVAMINDTVNKIVSGNDYTSTAMKEQAKMSKTRDMVSLMRYMRYAHLVSSIVVVDKKKDIEYPMYNKSKIYEVLKQLGRSDQSDVDLLPAFEDFANDTIVSLNAVTPFICPSCKQGEDPDKAEIKDVVVIDIMAHFLVTLGWKYKVK